MEQDDWNVSANPKTLKPQAQMDGSGVSDLPHSGKLMKNVCVKRAYPDWPNAISTFTFGQLDKAPQEEIDPEMWNQFEKPFILSAPDPGIMVPPAPLPPYAPFHDQSQTPLKDPVESVPVSLGDETAVPMPPIGIKVPRKADVKAKAATAPKKLRDDPVPPAYNPPDTDCSFSNPGFKVKNLPMCFLKAWQGLFYDIKHYKDMPSKSFFKIFTNNTRIFYLAVWILVIIIIIMLALHVRKP